MQDFASSLMFLLVYFSTRNFILALMALALIETMPVAKSLLLKRRVPAHKLSILSLLWVSLFLSWKFQSPLFFQYKTSLIYFVLGLSLFIAPESWISYLYQDVAKDVMSLQSFQSLCPKIAQTFFVATLINIVAVSALSIPSWMIFKFFLGIALSLRIVWIVYPLMMLPKNSTNHQDVTGIVVKD